MFYETIGEKASNKGLSIFLT